VVEDPALVQVDAGVLAPEQLLRLPVERVDLVDDDAREKVLHGDALQHVVRADVLGLQDHVEGVRHRDLGALGQRVHHPRVLALERDDRDPDPRVPAALALLLVDEAAEGEHELAQAHVGVVAVAVLRELRAGERLGLVLGLAAEAEGAEAEVGQRDAADEQVELEATHGRLPSPVPARGTRV
jgi:hypothetical protein